VPSGRWQRWHFEIGGRRCTIDHWGAAAEGAKAPQRRLIDDPGRTEAAIDLEPLDGGLGSRPVEAVESTEFVPEARQHPL
jgi:hypothetical protein